MSAFWPWFEAEAAPKLGQRGPTFRRMFEYLDTLKRPVGIVETGCMRAIDNWKGDGCSTLLFNRYMQKNCGAVHSIEINHEAVILCRDIRSVMSEIYEGDSLRWLPQLKGQCDLLYLDSYDLDLIRPLLSQVHHINELMAALPLIRPHTLVVVDDSPVHLNAIGRPVVTGKGALVGRYAEEVGASMLFGAYQVGWTGMA